MSSTAISQALVLVKMVNPKLSDEQALVMAKEMVKVSRIFKVI